MRGEIASALEQKLSVVPVLVRGASLPGDLPDDIASTGWGGSYKLRDYS